MQVSEILDRTMADGCTAKDDAGGMDIAPVVDFYRGGDLVARVWCNGVPYPPVAAVGAAGFNADCVAVMMDSWAILPEALEGLSIDGLDAYLAEGMPGERFKRGEEGVTEAIVVVVVSESDGSAHRSRAYAKVDGAVVWGDEWAPPGNAEGGGIASDAIKRGFETREEVRAVLGSSGDVRPEPVCAELLTSKGCVVMLRNDG